MNSIIIDNIAFKVDIELLLKKLHMDRVSEDYETIERLVEEAEAIGKPKLITKISYIDSRGEDFVAIDDIKYVSRVLAVNLQSVHRVFPYIATCGVELYKWAENIEDMVEKFWAKAICEMALRCAIEGVSAYLRENYKVMKLSAMNPGSLKDWPLKEQRNLFKQFGDVKELIGVDLTESCLMIPVKSVSGILFETETNFESCQLCPRENCPNRRAPYEKGLFDEKYKKV